MGLFAFGAFRDHNEPDPPRSNTLILWWYLTHLRQPFPSCDSKWIYAIAFCQSTFLTSHDFCVEIRNKKVKFGLKSYFHLYLATQSKTTITQGFDLGWRFPPVWCKVCYGTLHYLWTATNHKEAYVIITYPFIDDKVQKC